MENNFLDELIAEAEQRDKKLEREHVDLILLEIRNLNSEIESTFDQAKRECEIIKSWALRRNSSAVSKIEFLEKKLELYFKEENLKTLTLPNGELKFRKSPNRIEITDMSEFLKHANASVIDEIPALIKPNLTKLRSYITKTGRMPKGCTEIPGEIKFHYTIFKEKINGQSASKAGAANQLTDAA